jgi:lipoyl(octanoyl) transferase
MGWRRTFFGAARRACNKSVGVGQGRPPGSAGKEARRSECEYDRSRSTEGFDLAQFRDDLPIDLKPRGGPWLPTEWRRSRGLVPYPAALAAMDARTDAIAQGRASELVWLLEHPPLYTAGTSARQQELLEAKFPVFSAGRGGQFTYHGPGQRVVYVMLDLKRRVPDLRRFVAALEAWIIGTLAVFGVAGERREDRIGVWVRRPDRGEGREDKIAAIGIRVRRFVTLHGIALNVGPELGHFSGIVPCGVSGPRCGVTSLADLGVLAGMDEVDRELRQKFEALCGPTDLAVGDPPEMAEEMASS